MPIKDFDTTVRILKLFSDWSGTSCSDIWWRTDGEYAPLTIFVNCNDLFAWACADCHEVNAENIERLEQTFKDVKEIDDGSGDCLEHAPLLWVARERKCRPQWAYYEYFPKQMHHLFNEVSDKPGYGWPDE